MKDFTAYWNRSTRSAVSASIQVGHPVRQAMRLFVTDCEAARRCLRDAVWISTNGLRLSMRRRVAIWTVPGRPRYRSARWSLYRRRDRRESRGVSDA
jgi:hypothetical protein